MAAFSPAFSPTGFYAGAAADVTAELTRVAAEVVGTFPENSVSRVVAEVMMAPELAHGVVSRAVLEVLQSAPPYVATVSRAVVEVLQEHTYIPPLPTAELHRIVTEVLGTAADFVGKRVTASRTVAEVIGSTSRRAKGLGFAPVALPGLTAMAVFLPPAGDDWQFLVSKAPLAELGAALEVRGVTGDMLISLFDGQNFVTSGFVAKPTGPVRIGWSSGAGGKVYLNGADVTAGGTGPIGAMSLSQIVREVGEGYPPGGTLKELMVWNRALTSTERSNVDTYLTCKWFTPGCEPTELVCT